MTWETFVPTLSAIFVGVTLFYMQRAQKKRDEAAEKRQKERDAAQAARERTADERTEMRRNLDYLQYRVTSASGDLTYEIANALEHNHINGNVKAAMELYNKEKAKYTNFMRRCCGELMQDDD